MVPEDAEQTRDADKFLLKLSASGPVVFARSGSASGLAKDSPESTGPSVSAQPNVLLKTTTASKRELELSLEDVFDSTSSPSTHRVSKDRRCFICYCVN